MVKPSVPAEALGIVLGGGIGAGKSQVAQFLQAMGANVINADRVGHGVLEPDGPANAQVARRWPSAVVDGHIDRSRLAAIVFSQPSELAELEAITHPLIVEEILRLAGQAEGPVVLEVPVMLPLGESWRRVFVDADEQSRIEWAVARGGDADDVRRRAAVQADRDAWLEWADEVIVNDGDLDALRKQAEALWERFGG